MLSPGWEYSAARKVSWKSSSRTATPLAQAAHSGETAVAESTPNSCAPRASEAGRWRRAWSRAETMGARLIEAMATEALSSTRLITMSVTSGETSTGSAATSAIFQASCSSRGSCADDG